MNTLNKTAKKSSSWSYAEKGFEEILHDLRSNTPEMTSQAGLINESLGKMVWHLVRKNSSGQEYDFAYKINPPKTPWRYIFKHSLAVREAVNYMMFEELDIPVAHVLAVGDIRKFFMLKSSFIATSYISDSLDGRKFMPGGEMRSEIALRKEYTLKHFALLAKIHDNMIFHKAFHPRNLLWRQNNGNMEVFWIDVARCRKTKASAMKRAVLVDIHTFFRDMQPTENELKEAVVFYLSCRKNGGYPGGAECLLKDLYAFKRRLFSKKRYKICE